LCESNKINPVILGIATSKQGSQKIHILRPRLPDIMSECRDRKDHEVKTSGSIPHDLVFAHECALLVNFHIYDTKKIPVDALGNLRNTGIHSLISHK
jgi:hypothetical protein